jgi:hypothetical protein
MWQTSGIIGQAAGFVRGSRFRPPCTLRQIAEPDSCFWKRRSRGRRDERISFSLLNNQATFFYSHPWICYLVVQPFDRPQDSPTLLVGQLIEFWPKLSHELPSTSAGIYSSRFSGYTIEKGIHFAIEPYLVHSRYLDKFSILKPSTSCLTPSRFTLPITAPEPVSVALFHPASVDLRPLRTCSSFLINSATAS